MTDVDLSTSERPDELIQLAWNAGGDRRAAIREGADAAMLLLAGEREEIVTLFWPVPRPLEAVNRWLENPRPAAGVSAALRPFASSVVPGCVLGSLITRLFVAPRMSETGGLIAMVPIIIASIALLGIVLKALIGAAVRRQVARLDEDTALGIVLEQLRRGMIVNAALVPRACVWIRRGLDPVSRGSDGHPDRARR